VTWQVLFLCGMFWSSTSRSKSVEQPSLRVIFWRSPFVSLMLF
jgi:hypothetical protein